MRSVRWSSWWMRKTGLRRSGRTISRTTLLPRSVSPLPKPIDSVFIHRRLLLSRGAFSFQFRRFLFEPLRNIHFSQKEKQNGDENRRDFGELQKSDAGENADRGRHPDER